MRVFPRNSKNLNKIFFFFNGSTSSSKVFGTTCIQKQKTIAHNFFFAMTEEFFCPPPPTTLFLKVSCASIHEAKQDTLVKTKNLVFRNENFCISLFKWREVQKYQNNYIQRRFTKTINLEIFKKRKDSPFSKSKCDTKIQKYIYKIKYTKI